MKNSPLTIIIITLFSTHTVANNLHLSPELKIGPYGGLGIQIGLTDVFRFDSAFISYGHTVYSSSMYNETIDSYRFGIQHMFGAERIHGMQLEVGIADYDGEKTKSGNTTKENALGSSIGASYVFQATEHLGLRAGVDFNYFPMSDTYIPYELSTNVNMGMVFTF